MLRTGVVLLLVASASALGNDTDPCTFGPGICPVTKENVLDVIYFDVADSYSCQAHCKKVNDCHFFTMYGIKDDPKDKMKCFLFKTCDNLEPCDECTTGSISLMSRHYLKN